MAIFAIELGCPVNAKMAYAHSSVSKKWLRRFQDFDTGINAFNDDLDREWRCEKIEIKYILYDFFPGDSFVPIKYKQSLMNIILLRNLLMHNYHLIEAILIKHSIKATVGD